MELLVGKWIILRDLQMVKFVLLEVHMFLLGIVWFASWPWPSNLLISAHKELCAFKDFSALFQIFIEIFTSQKLTRLAITSFLNISFFFSKVPLWIGYRYYFMIQIASTYSSQNIPWFKLVPGFTQVSFFLWLKFLQLQENMSIEILS